jgi:hypothetical protein
MKVFKIAGKDYRTHISDDKSGFVMCINTGERVYVKASSPHKVKIKLKDALQTLGYEFKDEEREVRLTDETHG